MSEIRARFVGSPDGAYVPNIPLEDGTTRDLVIPHGGELPNEIDGLKVPASFRDSLLEQKDNWTSAKRATTTAAKADKEG